MSDEAERQGAAVKGYVRAKWRGAAHAEAVERLGRTLDPGLRARIDAIGMDDQELLHVPDNAVLTRLAELEHEGERELARALNGARVIRRKRIDERADSGKFFRRHHRMRRG
jgi:hypothetical protein